MSSLKLHPVAQTALSAVSQVANLPGRLMEGASERLTGPLPNVTPAQVGNLRYGRQGCPRYACAAPSIAPDFLLKN